MKDRFTELYERVFDEEGNIKACGRDACMELIDYVENEYKIEVGREDAGFIKDKDRIIQIYKERSV